MNVDLRFRVVCGLSSTLLAKQVDELQAEGWQKLGTESVAVPVDQTRPPYLVQAMFCREKSGRIQLSKEGTEP